MDCWSWVGGGGWSDGGGALPFRVGVGVHWGRNPFRRLLSLWRSLLLPFPFPFPFLSSGFRTTTAILFGLMSFLLLSPSLLHLLPPTHPCFRNSPSLSFSVPFFDPPIFLFFLYAYKGICAISSFPKNRNRGSTT